MIRFFEEVTIDDVRQQGWYVGSPYSKFPKGLHIAHAEVSRATAELIREGIINVYSPIVDSHCLAMIGGLDPMDHAAWMKRNFWEMSRRDGLIIVMMEGWKDSVGLRMEAETFKKQGKPILHMVWP